MLHARAHSPLRATEYTTWMDGEMREGWEITLADRSAWCAPVAGEFEEAEKLKSLCELFGKKRLRSL